MDLILKMEPVLGPRTDPKLANQPFQSPTNLLCNNFSGVNIYKHTNSQADVKVLAPHSLESKFDECDAMGLKKQCISDVGSNAHK